MYTVVCVCGWSGAVWEHVDWAAVCQFFPVKAAEYTEGRRWYTSPRITRPGNVQVKYVVFVSQTMMSGWWQWTGGVFQMTMDSWRVSHKWQHSLVSQTTMDGGVSWTVMDSCVSQLMTNSCVSQVMDRSDRRRRTVVSHKRRQTVVSQSLGWTVVSDGWWFTVLAHRWRTGPTDDDKDGLLCLTVDDGQLCLTDIDRHLCLTENSG